MYGQNASAPNVCPGETDCDRFQSSAGTSQRSKERNACTGCDLFPTKRRGGKKETRRLDALVTRAMSLKRERDSGYPRPVERMTSGEFVTLMIVDELVDKEELALRRGAIEVAMMGFGLKKG